MPFSPLLDIRRRFAASQAQMAAIAGVNQATWSRWERGLRHPSLPELKKIRAEAIRRRLGWDERWLFGAAA